MIAAELATMQQGARTDLAQICAMSDAQTAALLNVSERSVETAKAVKREAIPEVIKLVEDRLGHGHWLPWLDGEFGWTEMTATRFMRVYDMVKSRNLRDLPSFDVSALYLLAAPSTPEAVRQIANIHRRHMTRAQRAMALAMIAPEPDGRGGRGKTSKILQVYEGDERNAMRVAVNKARFVLKYKSDLAQEVLGGMLQLDPAYKQGAGLDLLSAPVARADAGADRG